MPSSDLARGRLLALVAPVFWSITGVVVRFMQDANEWQINFYRSVSLALFVLAVLLVRYRADTLNIIRATGARGALAGLFVGLAMLSNIVALKHTSVANAVFVMASGPVVAAVFGWIWLKERVTAVTWVAIALAVVGMGIMVGGGIAQGSVFGNLVAVFGVGFFGFYAVTLRGGAHLDMTPAVFYAGVFAACAAALVMLLTGTSFATNGADIGLCVMLGIVQLGIGSILFALAASVVPAAELTLFALGEPVLAPIWAWLGVGEVPSASTLLGGAVILVALALQANAYKRGG